MANLGYKLSDQTVGNRPAVVNNLSVAQGGCFIRSRKGSHPAMHWRMYDTAFTTLYVLKNAPTAIHKDTADALGTFGCMACLGGFEGNELVFPKYRIGVDYRPGDVILADVHEFHTNLPLLSGERVSCVFFVREGMNECPVGKVSASSKTTAII